MMNVVYSNPKACRDGVLSCSGGSRASQGELSVINNHDSHAFCSSVGGGGGGGKRRRPTVRGGLGLRGGTRHAELIASTITTANLRHGPGTEVGWQRFASGLVYFARY